jgi:type VI secretion system protein ImpA
MDGLDLAALLEPIPGESPAGTDPREDFAADALYFRLRDARSEARAAEREADSAGDAEAGAAGQWRPVLALAVEMLRTRAKDLEAASWLTEALLRLDQLEGMADGFALMTGLIERYWDDLHPLPDEEGLLRRVAPVAGLNGEGADGTLIQPLRKVPLFHLPGGGTLAYWQYQQSVELQAIADTARRQQRLNAGALPFEEVERAARAAAPALAALRQAAARALSMWDALDAAFIARAGADAPPTSRIRQLLTELLDLASRYAEAEPQAGDAPVDAAPVPAPAAAASVPGRIATREDALHLLDEIASFFRRTEPHSPLAYTLHEAVRRGRLTWPELLEEIVPDQDSRAAILRSLGIRPPRPGE